MIALIDYGIGNLRSVYKALEAVGAKVILTSDPGEILKAEKVVLPGVGAFGDGIVGLQSRQLDKVVLEVIENQTPLLGICVGMQLLFESSNEMGDHRGLGLMPGVVKRFESDELKIPQTGWNKIEPGVGSILLKGLRPGCYAYFNHGYFCDAEQHDEVLGWTEYGVKYASIVGKGRLFGVQFHPEKSQVVGLKILKNFLEDG